MNYMNESLKKIESGNIIVWITQPNEVKTMLKRREIAFKQVDGKMEDNKGNIETAGTFGRGLFSEYIIEGPNNWTIIKWLDTVVENIFNPLGTGAIFTKVTDKEINLKRFRYQLHDEFEYPNMAFSFTYSYLRGIFMSAFPNDEILMKSSMAVGAPIINLTLKTIK